MMLFMTVSILWLGLQCISASVQQRTVNRSMILWENGEDIAWSLLVLMLLTDITVDTARGSRGLEAK